MDTIINYYPTKEMFSITFILNIYSYVHDYYSITLLRPIIRHVS